MNTLHDGAQYIRGRVSKIYQEGDKLICKGEDTLTSTPVTVAADMVVLETAMVPAEGIDELAAKFTVGRDADGWLVEAHAKLRPVETNTAGIYLAGTAQGPKDIPDSVCQAGAAASKVIGLLNKDALQSNPQISHVNEALCQGDGACANICPYGAISLVEKTFRENSRKVTRPVAQVNPGLCQGCGACTVTCRAGAMDLLGYTNESIMREVDALCRW